MSAKSYLCRDVNGNVHIVKETELIKRSSVYGVIVSGNEVLLVKDRTSEDKWDLPGGGIEQGEDHIKALHREVQEETGLTITQEPEMICQFMEYFYDIDSNRGWESTRSFFKVTCEGKPVFEGNNHDIVECRFFSQPLNPTEVAAVAREVVSMSLQQKGPEDYLFRAI